MRSSRALFIGLVLAVLCSVAGVLSATTPASAFVTFMSSTAQNVPEGDATSRTVGTFKTDHPGDTFTATIVWGDGATTSGTITGPDGSGIYTISGGHAYADEGTFTFEVRVTETGTSPDLSNVFGTATVTEADVLTASPITITPTEGSSFSGPVATFTDTFTGNVASDFTATIDWGDGTVTAGTVTGTSPGSFTVSGSHTYAQDGPFTLTVILSDDAPGTATATATGTANVGEFSFGLSVLPNTTTEGQVFSGTVATFTDPASDDPPGDYTASINWGDGTTTPGIVTGAAGSFTISGTHTYADEGTFSVVVTAFENVEPGFFITSGNSMTVSEADVLFGHPATFSATQGTAFTGTVATFTDTFTGNVASDFTATIDWGDGTVTAGTVTEPTPGNYAVDGTHTYGLIGTKNVTVTLTDDAPGTASASIVSTANVATNCTSTISNSTVTKVTLGPGTTCLKNDTVSRTIVVPAGASIAIVDSTLKGGLTARNPNQVTVCHSTVSGNVTTSHATGFVLLGDPGDDSCAGNNFLRGVTLTSNAGGLELGHNHITRSVKVTGTTGHGPAAEDVGTEIEANTIGRNLTCTNNTPVATNDSQPNTVSGTQTGECAAPF